MTALPAAGPAIRRICLVATEESGDRLGASLMKVLRQRLGDGVAFSGVGGRGMIGEGLVSLFPIEELSIVGFTAVLKQLPKILRLIRGTVDAIVASQPDVLVIIDSPDFTQRVAKRVRARDGAIPIVNYVAPTVWAWRPGRARTMRGYVDHVLGLLPFEPDAFRRLDGPPCTYVGHPLIEQLASLRPTPEEQARREAAPPRLLVLPGSRRSEVGRHMPVFGETLARLQAQGIAFEAVLPTTPHLEAAVKAGVANWPVQPTIIMGEAEKRSAFRSARAAEGGALLGLAHDDGRLHRPIGHPCFDSGFEMRCRRQHRFERDALGLQPGQGLAEHRHMPPDLAAPAAGQYQQPWRRGLAARLLLRGGTQARKLLDQGMADIGAGRTIEPAECVGLERQQAEDMIDIATHRPCPARPPRPHGRRHVVDDRDRAIARANPLRHALGEIGTVDDDEHVRLRRDDRIHRAADQAQDLGQLLQHGGETDDRQLLDRKQRDETLADHAAAADAGKRDAIPETLAQHLHQAGAETVPRLLGRDQTDPADGRACRGERRHAATPVMNRPARSAAETVSCGSASSV